MTEQRSASGLPQIDLKALVAMGGGTDLLFPPPQEIIPGVLSYLNHPFALVHGYRFLRLSLHVPRGTADATPVVVYASGGGFRLSATHIGPWRCLLHHGYAVAAVEYRVASEIKHPGPLYDVKGAVRWLRANAADFGLDTDRIAAWGSSAGGYLLSMAAVTNGTAEFEGDVGGNLEHSSEIAAVIDHYGPTDFLAMAEDTNEVPGVMERFGMPTSSDSVYLGYVPQERPDEAAKAAVTTYVNERTVPFLIMHGDADTRLGIGQSRRLYEALRRAGVEATFHVLPGANHAAPAFQADDVNALAVAFVNHHIRAAKLARAASV